MYDVLSIAAIVDQFGAELVHGRIQNVLQVDQLTIALEIYAQRQRRWLIASAHPEHSRVLLTARRVDADAERVTPLLLLLRKYARGGRIVSVSQPRYERIIQVSIAKPLNTDNADAEDEDDDEDFDLVYTDLFIELMGRRSNIILVSSEGRMMDAVKRVSPEMSRVRPIRPGLEYIPPPPLTKADPLRATAPALHDRLAEADSDLSRALVANYLGVSPTIAREIAIRAGVDPKVPASSIDDAAAEPLVHALRRVFSPLETGDWQPVVYVTEDDSAQFSAIPLESLAGQDSVTSTQFDSISAAAEAAWEATARTASSARQRHAIRRERLITEVDEARSRVEHRVRSLQEQAQRADEAEALRTMGEMIYAFIADIQAGQTELRTPDGLIIPLDPDLTPSQNAQEYFERYRKARSAEENLPGMLNTARGELAYLDQLRSMAQLADTYDDIESVRMEWLAFAERQGGIKASRPKGARPSKSARRPRTWRTSSGDTILVGRTGQQNETVTFDIAGPNDLWLHARNMPGAHVILRSNGEPAQQVIERAAALAAWYSDGRYSTAVPVDVTERRYVRKLKGAGPGMVTYRNERTLNVRPLPEGDLDLEPGNT